LQIVWPWPSYGFDEPAFVWSFLILHFGIPAVPEWTNRVVAELNSKKKIQHLMGFGYTGLAVKTDPQELLRLIEHGLRKRNTFPLTDKWASAVARRHGISSLAITRPLQ
jgi:hypothetical protein